MVLEDEPLVQKVALSARLIAAIKAGVAQAQASAAARRPQKVDHRLRQLCLPSGDAYLAVSPLAAGGFSVAIGDGVQAWHAARKAEEAEEAEEASSPSSKSARQRIQQLSFLVGGANPRNASLHWTHPAFQKPLWFDAPQRNAALSEVWRFVYHGWRPRITPKEAHPVMAQIEALQTGGWEDMVSVQTVNAQASGALQTLVRQCHHQAQVFAELLQEHTFDHEGKTRAIDEELLRLTRHTPPRPLDLALVAHAFGPDYRQDLAATMVSRLSQLSSLSDHGRHFRHESVRERLRQAVVRVLERLV
jgi:hypothetical protein